VPSANDWAYPVHRRLRETGCIFITGSTRRCTLAAWFDHIDERLRAFIEAQHIFFVATAPNDLEEGFVNLSPKGRTLLHVLGPNKVGYLDYPGSGNETAKHTEENGRITLMLCSFDATAMILRLYGRGRRVDLDDAELLGHRAIFESDFHPYVRQAFIVDVEKVQTSCGYAVPRMDFREDRETLDKWCENKTVARQVVDGLPQPGQFVKKDGTVLAER
jgi:hypothetical protein